MGHSVGSFWRFCTRGAWKAVSGAEARGERPASSGIGGPTWSRAVLKETGTSGRPSTPGPAVVRRAVRADRARMQRPQSPDRPDRGTRRRPEAPDDRRALKFDAGGRGGGPATGPLADGR